MASYYYLAAQLPYLSYGQKPPMSVAEFRDQTKPLLTSQDKVFFDMVDLDPADKMEDSLEKSGPSYADDARPSGCDFIDLWREWERTLRLNLARQRVQKTKLEGVALVEPPALPTDAVAAAARAVTATESPLAAELVLDRARWDAIEALQGINYFNRNTIFAFLLKLILLERHAMFNVEKGFAEYKSLYASILGSVQPGSSPAGEIK